MRNAAQNLHELWVHRAADESAQKYASELIESANRFKLSKVNELD